MTGFFGLLLEIHTRPSCIKLACISIRKKKKEEKLNQPHISNKLSFPELTPVVEAHESSRKEDLLLQGPVSPFHCLNVSMIIIYEGGFSVLWMPFSFLSSISFCCCRADLPHYRVSSVRTGSWSAVLSLVPRRLPSTLRCSVHSR